MEKIKFIAKSILGLDLTTPIYKATRETNLPGDTNQYNNHEPK